MRTLPDLPRLPHPYLAWRAMRLVFRALVPQRRWHPPRLSGLELFTTRAPDGVRLEGWCAHPPGAPLTILAVHGLLRNATMDGIPLWASAWLRRGLAIAAVDLRAHGRSGDAVPGLGYAESWDIRAAMDALVARGFPGRFLVVGGSLGALAAQRAAYDDARILGAALLAMPGSPWHGARVGGEHIAALARDELMKELQPWAASLFGPVVTALGQQSARLGRLVNLAYGTDVLRHGDGRCFGPPPAHRPRILAITGELDLFGPAASLAAWRAFPGFVPGTEAFRAPHERPHQDRWFILAPGRQHPPMPGNLLEWPELPVLLDELLAVVLR